MNTCFISGRITDNAVIKGAKTKAMLFTVETAQVTNGSEGKEIVTQVPCVMFNPAPEVESLLTTQGKGVRVGFQGRINSTRFDGNDGKPRFRTEVVVFNRSLLFAKE